MRTVHPSCSGLLSLILACRKNWGRHTTLRNRPRWTRSLALGISSFLIATGGALWPQNLSAAPVYVQGNDADPQGAQATVTVAYSAVQTAGDLNVVMVGWNDTTNVISSVTDKLGNGYTLAVGPTKQSTSLSQAIYYAKNIVAGSNTVTVTFSGAAAYPDIRVL